MIWFYPDNIESGGKCGLRNIKIEYENKNIKISIEKSFKLIYSNTTLELVRHSL